MKHGLPLFSLGLAIWFLSTSPALAGGQRICARCAKKICHLTVSTTTEESECFEIECEEVCIPPVTLPWQCGPKNCGRVRTVNVLKSEKRPRQVRQYQWEVRTLCSHCRGSIPLSTSDIMSGENRSAADALPPPETLPIPRAEPAPDAKGAPEAQGDSEARRAPEAPPAASAAIRSKSFVVKHPGPYAYNQRPGSGRAIAGWIAANVRLPSPRSIPAESDP